MPHRNAPQCRLCHSNNTRSSFISYYQGGVWPIWECARCEVRFIEDTVSGQDANLEYYEKLSAIEIKDTETPDPYPLDRYWGQRLQRIRKAYESHHPHRWRNLRICDVGCSTGNFLTRCPADWEKYGVELSPSLAECAASRGLTVYFDIVTMFAIIEHADAPRSLIRAAHRILRPSGLLVVMTGNYRSLQARAQGFNWTLYTPPEHQFFFSQRSLDYVLTSAGFRRVRWDHDTGRAQWSSVRLLDTLFNGIIFAWQIAPLVSALPLFTDMYGYYLKK
jgi:SAM-dependent methyltransferase